MTILPAYLPMAPIRLYQCGHLTWIAAGLLLWKAGEALAACAGTDRRAAAARWIAWAVVGTLCVALILNVILVKRHGLAFTDYAGTLRTYFRNPTPITLHGERIYLQARRGRQLNQIVGHIRARTEEGETILVFPNQALLYFLCDRPNPTRFVGTFTLKYPDEAEDRRFWSEWVEDARRASPRYLIVSRKFLDSDSQHYFRAVIAKRYEPDREFDELVVMKRRRNR